jgi:HAD superfamily hydrolase (TIGR01509 family)
MDALLLDFNGVIVDDERLHFAAFRDALADEGIPLDAAAYDADYLGLDDRAAFREALRRADRPFEPRTIARLAADKAARYAVLAARDLPLVPGAAAFVRAAAGRFAVAVASGALRREIDAGLALAGIADAVATIVSAEEVHTSKPDPAGLRLALARLARANPGAGPWRAVVVEDSLPGLLAARALGAGCAMLTTSHQAAALARADVVWASFLGHQPDELVPLLLPVEVR